MNQAAVPGDGPGNASDSTTRARIRDAAMHQFAELGFRGATIRGIAREAGVSPGLVQHHFGTKENLQAECDAYVFEVFERALEEGYRDGGISDPNFISEMVTTMTPIMTYMGARMTRESPTGSRWFEMLVTFNREMLRKGDLGRRVPEHEDVDAIAAVLTTLQLGLVMLYDRVFEVIGEEKGDPKALARVGRARLYIASGALLSDDVIQQIQTGLDKFEDHDHPESGGIVRDGEGEPR